MDADGLLPEAVPREMGTPGNGLLLLSCTLITLQEAFPVNLFVICTRLHFLYDFLFPSWVSRSSLSDSLSDL